MAWITENLHGWYIFNFHNTDNRICGLKCIRLQNREIAEAKQVTNRTHRLLNPVWFPVKCLLYERRDCHLIQNELISSYSGTVWIRSCTSLVAKTFISKTEISSFQHILRPHLLLERNPLLAMLWQASLLLCKDRLCVEFGFCLCYTLNPH